jgi:translation initiation factor 2 beta subunit (eIF-2beta)/eIF-5
MDKTTNLNYLIGKYTEKEIKTIVYNFIQKYLLCVLCDKPEVILKYTNDKIKQKCKACGNKCFINNNNDDDIIQIIKKYQ